MRKAFCLFGFLFLYTVAFYACRKEAVLDSSSKEVIDKVNAYLDSQKSTNQSTKNTNIDVLKNNLDFSVLRFEQLDEEKQFLIVPIKEDFKTIYKLDKRLVNYLMLTLDKTSNIIKSSVALYTPDIKSLTKKVPDNTFSKIFNLETLDCNGQFRFTSISGSFLYQLNFKEGKFKSIGKMQQGSTSNSSSREMGCVDWYLITTYYENGVVVDETKEYLYTSCDTACSDPHTLCRDPNSDGGGGSTPPEEEYEVEVVKGADYEWSVQNIPEAFGSGWLRQSNHLVAKFNNRNASKNRFMGGNSSSIELLGNSWGQNGTVAYSNTSSTVTVNSNTQVTLASSGTMRFFINDVTFNYSGSKTASLSECSWY